jgi:uncharacterized protein YjbI with pentapeptide repeats
MLGLAIVWALFVPIADLLAHHDVGSATGPLHETALDNARGRLLTLGAGLVAAAALVFTALNFSLLRRNSEQADQWQRRTHELTEQGQVTDRYTKAIEQLGSKELDVRIGGIYALERVARDSARDHPVAIEVLTAFIREHSREPWPPAEADGAEPERSTWPDVQAALTVVGRRDADRTIRSINLARAALPGAILTRAELAGANLDRADLSGAMLAEAHLGGAYLSEAHLGGAYLSEADLTGATLPSRDLTAAYLRGAFLAMANLRNACLSGATLIDVQLADADLAGADLTRAHLAGADLTDANLTRVNLTDTIFAAVVFYSADLTRGTLRRANLSGARWPKGAPVPEGWRLDTGSGRLAASSDTGTAEGN